jgi:hypothetical protein
MKIPPGDAYPGYDRLSTSSMKSAIHSGEIRRSFPILMLRSRPERIR